MIIGHVTLNPTIESLQPRTYTVHIVDDEAYVQTHRGLEVYQTFAENLLNSASRDAVPLIKSVDALLESWHEAA